MSQTAQAVENALKGEKTFKTVQFAITGDRETDLIAGILAVVDDCIGRLPQQQAWGPPASAYWGANRVLNYIASRLKAEAEIAQGREDSYKQMSQGWQTVAQSSLGSAAPGVSGLGGQICQTSSANVHPKMSQSAMTPAQLRKNQSALMQALQQLEEKQP